ncbi:MAG: hypothetical protein ABIF01_01055 [Candidatus Micrarchaeota archaeon]
MKESLKISKTFVCSCGRDYSLELTTDLAVDNLLIEVSCPSCGEKRTVSAGSLLNNRASQSQAPSQGYSQSSSSSSESIPSLSFMDSMEVQGSNSESSASSDSSSSPAHTNYDDDELGGAYSDMFGDR